MKTLLVTVLTFTYGNSVHAETELSLYDGNGQASAYIALDNDLSIYLWSGEPVAYLSKNGSSEFDVYGFNGKHLGWFTEGVMRDHSGYAVCAVESAIRYHKLEPLKGLRSLTPLKSLEELAPLKPFFTNEWTGLSCTYFLRTGE